MPGETWRQVLEAGVESVWGTVVPASRQLYPLLEGFNFTNEREGRPKRMAVNSRANVRGFTSGPDLVGGTMPVDMGPEELVEPLLITVQGGVTPTTPVGGTLAKLWTFIPSNALPNSATLRYNDGANIFVVAGAYGQSITFQGSADGASTATVELFAKSLATGTLTGGLPQRTPEFLEGWQAQLYIDNFGGTPGTTLVVALTDWNVVLANNLTRKFYADNDRSANKIPIGVLDAAATLTFEASEAATLTEFNNWNTDTPRLVRLEFLGPIDGIEAGQRRFLHIDLPGNWMTPELSGEGDGTREYTFTLQARYDSVNAFMARIRVQNARATAWAG
jgi:hypothetical protein